MQTGSTVSRFAATAAVEWLVWAAMARGKNPGGETVKKVRLVQAANCIGSLSTAEPSQTDPGADAGCGRIRNNDETFWMSFGEGIQVYLKTRRLTQRKVDRGDNNEGEETPWFDASMT